MRLTRKVLKNKAKPYTFGNPTRNQFLAQAMMDIMRREKGIGLAAPQLGMSKRLFVMCVDGHERVCFNPEITEMSTNQVEYREGCLSYKKDSCTITRPEAISVRYQNYRGDWYAERLDGLMARCFQHELDHLDGITMHDRYKEQNATKPRN